jgi:hypothetical protein
VRAKRLKEKKGGFLATVDKRSEQRSVGMIAAILGDQHHSVLTMLMLLDSS